MIVLCHVKLICFVIVDLVISYFLLTCFFLFWHFYVLDTFGNFLHVHGLCFLQIIRGLIPFL